MAATCVDQSRYVSALEGIIKTLGKALPTICNNTSQTGTIIPGNPTMGTKQVEKIPDYNDRTPYKVCDKVMYNGIAYQMFNAAGPAGYNPTRDSLWIKLDEMTLQRKPDLAKCPASATTTAPPPVASGKIPNYDDRKVYKICDKVMYNGVPYQMFADAGQPGYIPLKDNLWIKLDEMTLQRRPDLAKCPASGGRRTLLKRSKKSKGRKTRSRR